MSIFGRSHDPMVDCIPDGGAPDPAGLQRQTTGK